MSSLPTARRGPVILISSVAAVGGFLFGFDSGVINGTVDGLAHSFGTAAAGTGFAVASVLLGCAAGAFLAGTLADRFGRRPMLILTALLFTLAGYGSGAAGSAAQFIGVRLAGGLAIGGASVLAPAYIAEIAPTSIRGVLTSLQQLAIVLGLFFSFVSNYLIARAAGSAEAPFWLGYEAWRWMLWAEVIPAAAFLLGCLFIPESPRYLVARGKIDDARRVFTRTVGGDVDKLIGQVQQSHAGAARSPWSNLLDPAFGLRPIVWTGVALSSLQQLVGINVIFYYGEVLYKAAGASEGTALLMNVQTGLTNILATLAAMALIDRLGRKPLLLLGSLGMTATLAVVVGVFSTGALNDDHSLALSRTASVVGVVAINLYIVSFGVSWGPVVWVMLSEMFPNKLRGAGLAVAGAAQWLANFLVTVSFPVLLKSIGLAGAYTLYALAAVASLAFVWACLRETRGKALEEM